MSAVPKIKISRGRRNRRRSQDGLNIVRVQLCSNCGKSTLSHHVCRNCGFYKGRKAVQQ